MQDNQQSDPLLVQLFTEASAHQYQGNLSMALVAYKRIQRQFPDFVDAWINASVVLSALDRPEEAMDMAVKAVELLPENPTVLFVLAAIQQQLGQIEDSKIIYNKVDKLQEFYVRNGQFVEAIAIIDIFIQAHPDNSELWGNRGYVKIQAMDLAGAEDDITKALKLKKNNAISRYNLSCVQFLQHRYHEAWPNYRTRMELPEWQRIVRDFGKPQWQGEPLDGRTLLVYYEQGLGDNIQCSRFLLQLKQFGGCILYLVPKPLQRLLSDIPGVDGLLVEGEPLPEFDFVVPLMELPPILDVGISDLAPLPPPTLPEQQAIPELERPGFKVGLVWAGDKIHLNNALRSMDPHHFDALADIEGIAWYGLQLPKATELPNLPGIIDLSHHMNDFLDSAQIIRQLDLVVTVDTSMAHLAGFLGLPAVVLLAFKPDWRWGATGSHTPWYPSLTLLRQPTHGDWKSVVGELRILITERINSGNQ